MVGKELVEGWAVLHKSGADEATKLGKFEEMKKFMDSPANKGKSIDDLAKEVKDFGGYKEWVKYEKMGGLVRHKIDADLLDELSKIEINANNLDAIEAIIVKKKTDEIGFLFDKDGKLLAGPLTSQKGEKGVSIPFPDVAKQLETKFGINKDGLKGSTFTHNHPIDDMPLNAYKQDPDWKPGSFSLEDVENAMNLQQNMVRATTELGHTFILKSKSGSLPSIRKEIRYAYGEWEKTLYDLSDEFMSKLVEGMVDPKYVNFQLAKKLHVLAKKRANLANEGLFDLHQFVDHEIWQEVVKAFNKQGHQLVYQVIKK